MDELTFASPEMAWLAVPAVVLTAWGLVQLRRLSIRLARLGTGPVIHRLIASFSPRRATWQWVCVGLAGVLLAASAMRPRYGLRETEVANAGIDVVFAVDASKSMLVRDVVPNRLQGTMLEISGLLEQLAGGRVALVPFAGIPFVQCPLTTDQEVIRTYMGELKPSDMPVGGTNIGRAISLAAEVLTGGKQQAEAKLRGNLIPQFKGSKHKAIVLFSDGEDHEGAALKAAKKAAAQGIRIYTVGVGSGFGDPVPIISGDGTVTGTLKDSSGNPIFSKLNGKLLTAIAKATGGKYLHYANKTVVPDLFAALDALEKAEYAETFKLLGEDRYQYLLGPALLLLLISLLLTPRRALARAAVVLVGLAMLPMQSAQAAKPAQVPTASQMATAPPAKLAPAEPPAASPKPAAKRSGERTQAEARRDQSWMERENPDIADGRDLIAAGKPGEALTAFRAAKENRPEHAVIWYNIGLSQAILGQYEEAAKALGRALSALAESDPELEADIHYTSGTSELLWGQDVLARAASARQANAGGGSAKPDPAPGATLGGAPGKKAPGKKSAATDAKTVENEAAGHFRTAVERLQEALMAAPSRVDVRRNLELARMLAYPPCERRDKAMEPNNQVAQAKPLKLDPKKKETSFTLVSCPIDRDLFQLPLRAGDRLTVTVDAKEPDDKLIDPLDRDSSRPVELAVQLRSLDGQTVIRGGDAPTQTVQWADVRQDERILVDVRNVAEQEANYDLKVKILPACPRTEDPLEPNDTLQQAKEVPLGRPLPMRLCPRNEDWIAVRLSAGQGVLVKAKAEFDLGTETLELDVMGPDGALLSHGVQAKEGYLARMAYAPIPGLYYVRVRGGIDTEASYQLSISVLPPCQRRDDAYEQNDQALSANPMAKRHLSGPLPPMQLCPGDDDWYQVELAQGESLFVDLMAKVAELPDVAPLAGQLTVTVYDSAGRVWGKARGAPLKAGQESLGRTAAVLEPPAGKYWVRVTGGGVAAPTFPLPEMPAEARTIEVDPPKPRQQGQRGGMPGGMQGRPGMGRPGLGGQGFPTQPGGGFLPKSPGTTRNPTVRPPAPSQPRPPGITARPHGQLPGLIPGAGGLPAPGAAAQGPAGKAAPKRPPAPKIPKVILPDGYPRPAVNLSAARLDLPYQLQLRILPPCPEGNDKREPNNSAGKAARVKVGSQQLLRICKGDVDWLEIEQKTDQNVQVMARYDFAHGALQMEAFDEQGTTSVAKAQTAAPRLPGNAKGADTPEARRGRTATTGLVIKGGKDKRVVKLRIKADKETENFYVLRLQEPPPPSDKGKKKKQDNKKNKDDKKKKKKDDKKKKSDPKKKKDDKKKEKKKKKKKDDRRKEQLRRQMKRHDRNPKNLEAQEALRRSPFRNSRPTKDW
ncbi:MAG: VWA domain-containing protein [Myxococcales bacterium]|nr:VWA domain-containing protein [Myxococcales bacterium]